MRILSLAVAALVFSAQPVLAQTWQYDANAQPEPKAWIADGDYEVGAFCRNDMTYFYAIFPRDGLPKGETGERVHFKFRVDVPSTETFDVRFVTRGWDREGERAKVWFRGQAADDWVDAMTTAQRDILIQVDTTAAYPELVAEHIFSARGSTASLRALLGDCGE